MEVPPRPGLIVRGPTQKLDLIEGRGPGSLILSWELRKEPVSAAGVGAGRDPWWLPQGTPVLGGGQVLQRDVG